MICIPDYTRVLWSYLFQWYRNYILCIVPCLWYIATVFCCHFRWYEFQGICNAYYGTAIITTRIRIHSNQLHRRVSGLVVSFVTMSLDEAWRNNNSCFLGNLSLYCILCRLSHVDKAEFELENAEKSQKNMECTAKRETSKRQTHPPIVASCPVSPLLTAQTSISSPCFLLE